MNRTGGDLFLTGRMEVGGGTLDLARLGAITVNGGTIANATIVNTGVRWVQFPTTGGSYITLDHVTLGTDLDLHLPKPPTVLSVVKLFTLDHHSLTVVVTQIVGLDGTTSTIGGVGEVVIDDDANVGGSGSISSATAY